MKMYWHSSVLIFLKLFKYGLLFNYRDILAINVKLAQLRSREKGRFPNCSSV